MAQFPLNTLPKEFSGTDIQMMGKSSFSGMNSFFFLTLAAEHWCHLVAAPQAMLDLMRSQWSLLVLADIFDTKRSCQGLFCPSYSSVRGCEFERLILCLGDRQATRPQ